MENEEFACALCAASGDVDMEACIASEGQRRLLAEDDNGLLLCLICYMRQANECLHCGRQVDCILPSPDCLGEPWLCEECLNLPYTIHVNSCYSDGCMTPEEFVEECFRSLGDSDRITLV